MSDGTSQPPAISRRRLLLGGADAAALTATGLAAVTAATAGTPAGRSVDGAIRQADGSPVTNSIAAAPISQYTY